MDPRSSINQITNSIWLGPFASPERKAALTDAGITHILNVGEAPSVLSAVEDGFREVCWHSIPDLEPLPQDLAMACLETLHRMLTDADARIYVHCIAGQNRSPTILWLYLVACGIDEDAARTTIERRAPDAIPGHSKLVTAQLVAAIKQMGAVNFLPHCRNSALTAVK